MDDLRTQLIACCRRLRISSNLAERAMAAGDSSKQEYLYSLLKSELDDRRKNRISRYINTAGFPRMYSRDEFRTEEVDFPSGVTFKSLLDLDFMKKGENVLMYGGTGTGKTMLSILIGLEACRRDRPVKFYRTAGLVNLLSESRANGSLSQLKKQLNTARLLILDEFGYVPYDRTGSQLLFDYISEIHERTPVILNTNLEFSQWVNVLYDVRMTTALIGRLTHHVELILFPGGNNRLKESSINKLFSRISDNTNTEEQRERL